LKDHGEYDSLDACHERSDTEVDVVVWRESAHVSFDTTPGRVLQVAVAVGLKSLPFRRWKMSCSETLTDAYRRGSAYPTYALDDLEDYNANKRDYLRFRFVDRSTLISQAPIESNGCSQSSSHEQVVGQCKVEMRMFRRK
jgi:hypothetical protein